MCALRDDITSTPFNSPWADGRISTTYRRSREGNDGGGRRKGEEKQEEQKQITIIQENEMNRHTGRYIPVQSTLVLN